MAYNQFTAMQLREAYHLAITEQAGLFAATPPAAISDWLRVTLQKQTVLALRGNTEKARSEYLIAPILAEVYEQMLGQNSFALETFAKLKSEPLRFLPR